MIMSERIEARGIDYIPAAERRGRPRALFVVWAASNLTYLYIVLGGTMVLLGLNAWQSLAVVAAGNLLWLLLGWLSVSGPSAGTPSEVITRAMYGVRGNRVQRLVHLAPTRRVHRARLLRAGARELGLPGSGAGGGARRGAVGGRRGRLHHHRLRPAVLG